MMRGVCTSVCHVMKTSVSHSVHARQWPDIFDDDMFGIDQLVKRLGYFRLCVAIQRLHDVCRNSADLRILVADVSTSPELTAWLAA